MKPFRPGQAYKAPYFTPNQIDNICCDELRGVGLLPNSPEPIRIDRFIEKRFNVYPQYEDLPNGVLGFTRFGKNGVTAVVISAALDAKRGKNAGRRALEGRTRNDWLNRCGPDVRPRYLADSRLRSNMVRSRSYRCLQAQR